MSSSTHLSAPVGPQFFQSDRLLQDTSLDVVLDVAVNDSGNWLVFITTGGAHIYHLSELSSNGAEDVEKEGIITDVLEDVEAEMAQGDIKKSVNHSNFSSKVISCPPGWDLVTVMKVTEAEGMVLGAAWAPSTLYTTALLVCTSQGIISLRRLVAEPSGFAAFSSSRHLPYFEEVYRTTLALSRACCATWAPVEFGRMFAVGGAVDGCITIFTGVDGVWIKESLYPPPVDASNSSDAHLQTSLPLGGEKPVCTSLCFGPFWPSSALLTAPLLRNGETRSSPADIAFLQLVSCDRGKYVWLWERQFRKPVSERGDRAGVSARPSPGASVRSPLDDDHSSNSSFEWTLKGALPLASSFCPSSHLSSRDGVTVMPFDCVPSWREVSWAESQGLPFHYVAAGSEEGFVAIWEFDEEEWKLVHADQSSANGAVTRLSWSEVGTFLLVSYADGRVVMWKETSNAGWKVATELEDLHGSDDGD